MAIVKDLSSTCRCTHTAKEHFVLIDGDVEERRHCSLCKCPTFVLGEKLAKHSMRFIPCPTCANTGWLVSDDEAK